MKVFLEKGEQREHINNYELVDVNGHFEKGKHVFGAIGGQLMQLCLAINAIASISSNDEIKKTFDEKKQKFIGDLTKNPGLINFMLHYIKDLKSDSF